MSRTIASRGELRVKYDAEQLQKLGGEGKAFKNSDGHYSYPIADDDDLRKAISAVGRGNASHDAIRAYIVRRAKSLGKSELIPDNWASDGSLKESNSVWNTLLERESYGDLRSALESALAEAVPPSSDGYRCAWVQDFTDNWVVYESQGALLQANYTRSADGISLDNPRKVRAVTAYVESKSAADIERRRKKAESMSGKAMEHRTFDATMECREADNGAITLTGYASVTDTPYEVGFYTETISKGAFKRTLRSEPDVTLLLNHEGLPLARTKGGTLTLEEDRLGLYVEAQLDPEDPDTATLVRKMRRGDLDGQMSFAFCAIDQDWSDDFSQRTLNAVEINRGDVSIVTQGANPATSAAVRSLTALGRNGVVEALQEVRAGKSISSNTMTVLEQVLSLVSNADDAVDEAQPLLANLMGVENPDSDDGDSNERAVTPIESTSLSAPSPLDNDFTKRARQRYEALQMRKAR